MEICCYSFENMNIETLFLNIRYQSYIIIKVIIYYNSLNTFYIKIIFIVWCYRYQTITSGSWDPIIYGSL